MRTMKGMTKTQTIFLRAFRDNPLGPPPSEWPSGAVLKRWLRKEKFRHALQGVRDALRFQADLHLAAASTSAAQVLQQCARMNAAPDGKPETLDADQLKTLNARMASMVQLLRMAHLRARFNVAEEQNPLRAFFKSLPYPPHDDAGEELDDDDEDLDDENEDLEDEDDEDA